MLIKKKSQSQQKLQMAILIILSSYKDIQILSAVGRTQLCKIIWNLKVRLMSFTIIRLHVSMNEYIEWNGTMLKPLKSERNGGLA